MTEKDPLENPGGMSAETLESVKAAIDMGIVDTAYIKQMLENAEGEDLRAKMITISEHLVVVAKQILPLSVRYTKFVESMMSARVRIADLHVDAQTALLKRMVSLSESATAEEFGYLAVAYTYLPQPYSQNFDPDLPTFAWSPEEPNEAPHGPDQDEV